MNTPLENKLLNSYKEEMIAFLKTHQEYYEEAVELAVSNKERLSWRSTWLLWSCIETNDPKIKEHINKIINVIPGRGDGHQRELIKILSVMKLNDEQEGKLFNICMDLWEQVDKTPSVRITAFKYIMKTAQKYPELSEEISFLTQDHYLESLSPGVRHSIKIIIADKETL